MKTVKRLVRALLRKQGYDIVPYNVGPQKSVRTNRLTLYDTATGKYYLPTDAKGDVVANTIINNGVFDKEVVDVASKYIRSGTTVLDVGANFGQMSILFSNLVGPSGTVYSFDADDFVFSVLQKNIEVNNKGKVIRPVFGAVHTVDGDSLFFPVQDFQEFESYGSYGIDYNGKKGREVKTITIDSLNISDPISFMKIDVQGGDLNAMQGAVKTIERHKMPVLFEYEYQFEDRYNFKFQEYVDFVARIGYKFEKVINGHNFLIIPA